jgi:hypothetical protein
VKLNHLPRPGNTCNASKTAPSKIKTSPEVKLVFFRCDTAPSFEIDTSDD